MRDELRGDGAERAEDEVVVDVKRWVRSNGVEHLAHPVDVLLIETTHRDDHVRQLQRAPARDVSETRLAIKEDVVRPSQVVFERGLEQLSSSSSWTEPSSRGGAPLKRA